MLVGSLFLVLMILFFDQNNISYFDRTEGDLESGAITGALMWAAFGLRLWLRARHRLGTLVTAVYWLGIGAFLMIAMAAYA